MDNTEMTVVNSTDSAPQERVVSEAAEAQERIFSAKEKVGELKKERDQVSSEIRQKEKNLRETEKLVKSLTDTKQIKLAQGVVHELEKELVRLRKKKKGTIDKLAASEKSLRRANQSVKEQEDRRTKHRKFYCGALVEALCRQDSGFREWFEEVVNRDFGRGAEKMEHRRVAFDWVDGVPRFPAEAMKKKAGDKNSLLAEATASGFFVTK